MHDGDNTLAASAALAIVTLWRALPQAMRVEVGRQLGLLDLTHVDGHGEWYADALLVRPASRYCPWIVLDPVSGTVATETTYT